MQYELFGVDALYRGFFALNRYRLRFQRYDGTWSSEIDREIFERGHAVAVLPYDPVRDQVVMIEQFRPGALEATGGPWMTEIVAGMIETDELVEEVAHREMQEEAGMTTSRLIPITRYWVSPGGTTESIYLFLALIDSSLATGIHGLAHEQEDIRVLTMPLDEALARVDQGTICSAAPIIALQWLGRHKERFAAPD
ncbi:MAG TPA: NUDIX domain-containing protein [Halothiobacillus sp.]|nr:NUDIX domain-containing protein [Halothiobacillus sp.]